MDIVDLNATGRYDDASHDTGSRWAVGTQGEARKWLRKTTPAQRAAVLLAIGFLLVLASQWYPWVRVTEVPSDIEGESIVRNASMINGNSLVAIPYFILWLTVFMSSGALLFVNAPHRRAPFGAAVGALASQFLIVLPVLHDPALLVYNGRISGLTVKHAAGSYIVIAAFVVIAAALVVAVSGRVAPTANDDRISAQIAPVPSIVAQTGGMKNDDYEQPADSGWSSHAIEVATTPVLAEGDDDQPAPPDHAMYMRPAEAGVARTRQG